VAGRVREALSRWRRKRHLKRHPEPHRNKDVPRKGGVADPREGGGVPGGSIPPVG